jgi:hypothetical protein
VKDILWQFLFKMSGAAHHNQSCRRQYCLKRNDIGVIHRFQLIIFSKLYIHAA